MHDDQTLCDKYGTKRETIPKKIRRTSVYLACHSTGRIADCLLNTNGRRTPILWRCVDIEPGQVQPCAVVHCDSADEAGKIFDSIIANANQYCIAYRAHKIGCEEKLEPSASLLRNWLIAGQLTMPHFPYLSDKNAKVKNASAPRQYTGIVK